MKFSKYLKMKLKKPKFWDYRKPNFLSNILFPISLAINFLSKVKIRPSKNFKDIKCICVGNIYLGGTGKTSLAIELKKILDKENINSCFIKKEYSDQEDEQLLLNNFGKTFINKSRVKALENAISEKYQVAIFDDGLQDKRIKFDLTFACFNQQNLIGNGRLIPAGPLREKIDILDKYKNIFLTGVGINNNNFKKFLLDRFPNLIFFESEYQLLNLDDFNKNKNFIIFSGIGNHITFLEMLKKNEFKIIHDFEFPDHYNYSFKDIQKIKHIAEKNNAEVLTTEKDYLRLSEKYKKDIKFTQICLKINKIDDLKKLLIS